VAAAVATSLSLSHERGGLELGWSLCPCTEDVHASCWIDMQDRLKLKDSVFIMFVYDPLPPPPLLLRAPPPTAYRWWCDKNKKTV